jgi:hypothetical protein
VARPSHRGVCLPENEDLIELRNVINVEVVCLDGCDHRAFKLETKNYNH